MYTVERRYQVFDDFIGIEGRALGNRLNYNNKRAGSAGTRPNKAIINIWSSDVRPLNRRQMPKG